MPTYRTPSFPPSGDQSLASIDLSPWIGANSTTALTTPGIGLCVMRNNQSLYNAGWGTYADATQVVSIIESASKLPAMMALMALCDAGTMDVSGHVGLGALDSTILQQRPDWATYPAGLNNGATAGQTFLTGTTRGAVTLRQMLNHIGGFEFTLDASQSHQDITHEQSAIYCMASDPSALGYAGAHGSCKFVQNTQFVYNGNDYHVLGAIMANRAGMYWPTLFNTMVPAVLGISSTRMFYPAIGAGANNPVVPRYLNADAVSYAQVLQTILNGGVGPNGVRVLSTSAVQQLLRGGNPNGLRTTFNPWDNVGPSGYGYAGGLWRNPPLSAPTVYSDEGFSGFSPWLDLKNGYCAVVSMSNPLNDANGNSQGWATGRAIEAYLRPLILAHLGTTPVYVSLPSYGASPTFR